MKKTPEYIIRFWHIYVQKYPTVTPTYKKMRHEYSMFRCEETIDLCEAKWGSLWRRNRFWDFLELGFWDFTCIHSVNGVWSDGAGTRRRGHSMRRPGPTQPPGCGCRLVFALPPSGLCLGPATEDVEIASPPPLHPPGSKQPPCLPETPRFPKLRRLAGPQIRRCAPVSEVPDISAFLPNKSSWIFFLFPASIPLRIIGTWVYMQFFEIPSHIYIIFFILGTWMNAPSVCRL
jgi:hypothetical protein